MSFLTLKVSERNALKAEFSELVDSFITIEESRFDLRYPDSIVEWAASGSFMGLNRIFDNRGQYYTLREFFQCYCPICSNIKGLQVFSVNKKELLNDKLMVLDWDKKVEFCPECGLTKDDFVEEGLLRDYNIMLGIVGMRAGKTMLASIIMTYAEQFLIRLGNVKKALGLDKVPFIEIACIAVSASQAKDTIWAQYREIRDSSDWFISLHKQMEDFGYMKSGAYDLSATSEVRNALCGYKAVMLSSSSASIAGRTRMMFIIDELGRFDTTESKRSATEVWRVGNNSLKTIRKIASQMWFPSWFGAMLAIESPISVDDYGMRLLADSDDVESMFKMKFATWEFNREFEFEDFKDEFDLDFHGAQRDFGADPPGAAIPYIEDWEMFTGLAEDKELVPNVIFQDTQRFVGDICYLGKKVIDARLDTDPWVIAGDAGKSRDTFALVGCKKVLDQNVMKMVQGFAMHILPNAAQKRYVDYECIVDVIKRICEKLRVVKICFDYWNSESIVQELQNEGYPAEQYAMSSVRVDDYFAFKNGYQSGRVALLPRKGNEDGDAKLMDSQTRQYWEAKRMQRSKDLKKVDHSSTSTSDLFECIVNCYRMLFDTSQKGNVIHQDFDIKKWGGIVKFRRW